MSTVPDRRDEPDVEPDVEPDLVGALEQCRRPSRIEVLDQSQQSCQIETLERRALWLKLVLTPGLGQARIYRLLRQFGLPEQIFDASLDALSEFIEAPLARSLKSDDDARAAAIELNLNWLRRPNHHLLALGDIQYPESLLDLSDPPPLLWAIGDLTLLHRPAIGVVGSRHASRGGVEHAREFAYSLGQAGWTILSGMARGIDAAAHQGGLGTAASTIAVLAHGLEKIYPASNRELGLAVAAKGLIVSEFALATLPLRSHFPRRNRLIAALGEGVLVVEAARQSGSLITARLAAELGRDVFALPGSIDSPLAKGCHYLIKQGAKLVECADDILGEIAPASYRRANAIGRQSVTQWSGKALGNTEKVATAIGADEAITGTKNEASTKSEASTYAKGEATTDGSIAINTDARAVLNALGWDPASIDELSAGHDISVATLSAQLTMLELANVIERLPDGRFQRLKAARHSARQQSSVLSATDSATDSVTDSTAGSAINGASFA